MLRGPGVSTGVSTSPRPSFQVVGGTLRLPAEGDRAQAGVGTALNGSRAERLPSAESIPVGGGSPRA